MNEAPRQTEQTQQHDPVRGRLPVVRRSGDRIIAAPAPCLALCLRGDPQNSVSDGCAWLRQAATEAPRADLLDAGRCPQGYAAAAEVTQLHGQSHVLVALRGPAPSDAPVTSADTGTGSTRAGEVVLDALANVEKLTGKLAQAHTENEGLAHEVLSNYEQLALLMDFSQQIAGVTRTEDVERVLLAQLGTLLKVDTIQVIRPDGASRSFDAARALLTGWHDDRDVRQQAEALGALRPESDNVIVRVVDGRQMLVCPISDDEETPEVALIARSPGAAEFTAGEMRICETLLTFGANFINNSKTHDRLRRLSMEATRALVHAIDKKDRYTSGHSERVGLMSRLTGEALDLPAKDLEQLEWSGLLHDIGKIGVPEEILNKPGKLTDSEFDVIKQHPQMGYDILAPIKAFEHILGGVLYHHENEDGSGYPHGLTGDEIPLFGRIIHVVDVFDALSSTRSYRQPFSIQRALDVVRSLVEERKMHPPIVTAFLQAFQDYRSKRPSDFSTVFPHAFDEEPTA